MVVLASAITTKNGKALLSRQFVELSRVRIEGLLAAFPKLMGSEKEHTFIETDSVRYVYQPLESLYILLITNKNSNILEDLETLHLLAKFVPEYSRLLEEKEVTKNAFEIISAFDEAVAMGYKERVNLQQIKNFTAMESHDEIRYKLEQKTKMAQAKRESDKQRKAIEKKRQDDKKFGIQHDDSSRHITSSNSGGSQRSVYQNEPIVESRRTESPKSEPRSSKGMQLGKGKKTGGYTEVLKEENINVEAVENSRPGSSALQTPSTNEKVRTLVAEKMVLQTQNDGGLQNFEIKGELTLTVFDASASKIKVQISQGQNKEFQFKAHPNMNKDAYANDNVLMLKDNSKSYPIGTGSTILKWRYVTKDEKAIPLTINVWPSTSGGETTVPVEYEKNCNFDLLDVTIAIPIPGPGPSIGDAEGSVEFDSRKGILYWRIPIIDDGNKSGSMEFTVPSAAAGAFFPIQVDFRSNTTYAAIQTVSVTTMGDNKPLEFASENTLGVEQYEIQQ